MKSTLFHYPFQARAGLVIILLAFTGLALLYDFTVPFFEKPDELKHFAVIQYIQQHHALPVVQAGVYQPWDQEGTQPPLYHLLAAMLTAPLDLGRFTEPARNPHYVDDRSFVWRERGNNNLYLHPPGEQWSLAPVFLAARLARWLSLLAGLATIGLTYRLGRLVLLEDSPAFALTAAALVAFVPQFLHVSTAITNDSLSVTLATAGLVGLAGLIKYGGSTRRAVYLGLILGLGAICKLSLLYLVPLTGLALLFDLHRRRRLAEWAGQVALIGGLAMGVAGWWFWRNWQLYGDISALSAHLLYRGGPLTPTPSLAQLWQTELTGLELSFWGAFGAGQILFEPGLYALLRGLKYVVLVGLVLGGWQVITKRRQVTTTPMALLALWVIIIFAALLRWMQITPASWGRLLFPALPAMAVLTVWSLSSLSPARRWGGALLPAGLLFGLALVSPFWYLQTAYRPTPLITVAEIPADNFTPLGWMIDDSLRLVGYRVKRDAVQPGDWLPVTLYWQAVRPAAVNYSAFVHLLGRAGAVIGQSNTYPDQGRRPTLLLPPGPVLPDTHYVYIDPAAEAPAVMRIAPGLFEFDDPARAAKPVVNTAGEPVDTLTGEILLRPHQWPALTPSRPLPANFAGQIQLVGYDWPIGAAAAPGETVPLTLYWQTLTPPGQALNLFIHLLEPGQPAPVAGFDGPPVYPTQHWQAGNTLVDRRSLTLPADLLPGRYELRLGWYDLNNFARLPRVDQSGDSVLLLTVTVE